MEMLHRLWPQKKKKRNVLLAVVTEKEIHGWVRGWGLIAFSVPSAVGVEGDAQCWYPAGGGDA